MKKSTIALSIGAVVLVGVGVFIYFRTRKAAGEAKSVDPVPDDGNGGDAGGTTQKFIGDIGEGAQKLIGDIKGGAQKLIGGLKGDLPERPKPPPIGFSPANPIPSKSITPGFEGYIQVQSGDSLGAISKRLGMVWGGWRMIRDRPENAWLLKYCKKGSTCSVKYYGGQTGIALYARYGKTVGIDCSSPGYGPTYSNVYKSKLTGQFPVIFWQEAA